MCLLQDLDRLHTPGDKVFMSPPSLSPFHEDYYFIYTICVQMARTFALRIARIAATIFIHNNQLNECQLQWSIPITNWCAICVHIAR